MADDKEESLTLSSDALAALQEFYAERDAQTEKLEKLKALVNEADEHRDGEGGEGGVRGVSEGSRGGNEPELSIHTFTEDWNESQFWYSDETANLLANQLLDGTTDESTIAVVSTPSVFVALKKMLATTAYTSPRPKMYLLEHDNRFAVFPEFVFYDFAQPFKLPNHLKGTVDRMICDPPFLSDDCQTKRGAGTPPRILICTGERMAVLVNRLYAPLGVRTTTYEPAHTGLKNEFCCYANFECGAWRWKDTER